MMNTQELEAQRQIFELEVETIVIYIQPNVVNNPARVLDEKIVVGGIISLHRQRIDPSGTVQHPTHMMYEEDGLNMEGSGGTRVIVLPAVPPGVKINNHKPYDSNIESKRYVKV